MLRRLLILTLLLCPLAALLYPQAVLANPDAPATAQTLVSESFALRGAPRYAPGFTHFDYVNPQAPRGGTLRLHATGTFDNLHRFAKRGSAAIGSDDLYDTLLISSDDEIEVYYPLIAERFEYTSDYSQVTFHIDPAATFQDGQPIRPEDVRFSFEKFAAEGVVQFKKYFSFVKSIEVLDARRVRFNLENAGREQMKALFSLNVLPEHYWKSRDFGEPLKEVPVGSSGVTIRDFKFGQYIVYENLDSYWARRRPSRIGQDNFQFVRYDYYRDDVVAFEAFKSGEFDFWQEPEAKNWATAYDFPALKRGEVVKEQLEHRIPQDTTGFVYNTKKPVFTDPRVRHALAYMLDFEWMNKALFYGQYRRTQSYFTNTEYAVSGLPDADELAILEPLRQLVPPQVFSEPFSLPVTEGDGNLRANMRAAIRLLDEAGWELKNQRMINRQSGVPLEFELLSYRPLTEKSAAPFKTNLARIGVTLNLRKVDNSQFINRLRSHEFDMIDARYPAFPYPSSDLKILWHSDFVDSTWNMANVTDPAIDALVEGIASNQEDPRSLLAYGRALDRVALWNFFMIPQWNLSAFRIAYRDVFARPAQRPQYALGLETWWFDAGKTARSGG